MVESKKGNNFAILGQPDKKICVQLCFMLMLYIEFQVPSSSNSLVLRPTKGIMDRGMGPNQFAPSTSLKLGIENDF